MSILKIKMIKNDLVLQC